MFDSSPVTPAGVSEQAPAPHGDAPGSSPIESAPIAGASADEAGVPAAGIGDASLTSDQVKLALRRVKDPELNLNIIDLGLVYDIQVEGNDVRIDMSLTSPGCPSGPEIMGDAQQQMESIPGVGAVAVNLVWSPPWTPERIEPRVRAYLGF